LQIVQMMAERNVSSIVILAEGESLHPLGIITEQDVVQFQALELDLMGLSAQLVMSTPLDRQLKLCNGSTPKCGLS
jgi:CBS domain-containing protein